MDKNNTCYDLTDTERDVLTVSLGLETFLYVGLLIYTIYVTKNFLCYQRNYCNFHLSAFYLLTYLIIGLRMLTFITFGINFWDDHKIAIASDVIWVLSFAAKMMLGIVQLHQFLLMSVEVSALESQSRQFVIEPTRAEQSKITCKKYLIHASVIFLIVADLGITAGALYELNRYAVDPSPKNYHVFSIFSGFCSAILGIVIAICLIIATAYLRAVLKRQRNKSEQNQRVLLTMTIIFSVSYGLSAVYFAFYGHYHLVVPNYFIRQFVDNGLYVLWDFPPIVSMLYWNVR